MNNLKDEWIDEIMWVPYAHEDFDIQDITMRMNLLTP
jgi:hypothetical protein